jgi:hypothetical protein
MFFQFVPWIEGIDLGKSEGLKRSTTGIDFEGTELPVYFEEQNSDILAIDGGKKIADEFFSFVGFASVLSGKVNRRASAIAFGG